MRISPTHPTVAHGLNPSIARTRWPTVLFILVMNFVTAASVPLPWVSLPDLPNPVGLKGMFSGVSEGRMLVAGGSNFPTAQREGGAKTYHDVIYHRALDASDDTPWLASRTALPNPTAEGSSLTTPAGIVAVGGRRSNGLSAAVDLISWDSVADDVRIQSLPSLPAPRASSGLAYLGGKLYLVGGEGLSADDAEFLTFDLAAWARGDAHVSWTPLPPSPGLRRFGATLMPVQLPSGPGLIQCGGRRFDDTLSEDDYLREAWRFDPALQTWTSVAPLPAPVLLGNAVSTGPTSFAIAGGSDGHDLARMKELDESYRLPDAIFAYDALTDAWAHVGQLPLGVAAAASLEADGQWIIAGGEYSPGQRTALVFRLSLKKLTPLQP
jgi:hypothetical protein